MKKSNHLALWNYNEKIQVNEHISVTANVSLQYGFMKLEAFARHQPHGAPETGQTEHRVTEYSMQIAGEGYRGNHLKKNKKNK